MSRVYGLGFEVHLSLGEQAEVNANAPDCLSNGRAPRLPRHIQVVSLLPCLSICRLFSLRCLQVPSSHMQVMSMACHMQVMILLPSLPASARRSVRGQTAVFKPSICAGARRNSAIFSANQGNVKRRFDRVSRRKSTRMAPIVSPMAARRAFC